MKLYVVDAFAEQLFEGNPAAVCVLEHYPKDELLQQITNENNLSETAFVVKENDGYRLRWFTPGGEIDLCGHATLAAGYVLMRDYVPEVTEVRFHTLSGVLIVRRKGELYEMEFPIYSFTPVAVTDDIVNAIGVRPAEAWIGRDLLCVMEQEEQVLELQPDLERVKQLDGLLLHVTAKGSQYDCVSRTFAPKCNVAEDPVCGSGHCHIAPYWAKVLDKTTLTARQASRRGGTLYCHMEEDRIFLSGKAMLYSIAELNLEV